MLEPLEPLEPAWRDLWARCPDASPFQHPAWLLPFCCHLAAGEPGAIAIREGGGEGGALVGLLPLEIERGGQAGRLLGAGPSDYLDALVDPRFPGAASALLAPLGDPRSPLRRCDLEQLRPSSPLLSASLPRGVRDDCAPQDVCPALPLAPGEADPLGAVPPGLRARLRQEARRLGRQGPLRFEVAGARDLEELLEALFDLHTRRWAERGGPGVLAGEAVRRFHRAAAPGLLAAGLLRLHALRVGERVAAALYLLMTPGRAWYYLGGFDPELGRYSAGSLLLERAIERAAAEGARELDFLRGVEPYKYRWGAVNRWTFRRRLTRERGGEGTR